MNPCPCGYYGDAGGRCQCTPERIRQYRQRLSGPLLDRIDMHIEVPALPRGELVRSQTVAGEPSKMVQERVQQARTRAVSRTGKANAALQGKELERCCQLTADGRQLLDQALSRLGLSARSYHRVLKFARTIADLAGEEGLTPAHLAEAIQLRCLDRPLYS